MYQPLFRCRVAALRVARRPSLRPCFVIREGVMLHADVLYTMSGSACLVISPGMTCAWEQSAVQVS